MRVAIVRDGRTAVVDVADDLASATVAGRTYSVTIVSRSATRVEVEVAGERVVVENWPEHFPQPFGPVDVNGERWSVRVESAPSDLPARPRDAVLPSAPAVVPGTAAPPAPSAPSGDGVPVVPPMPGRVIELKVAEGDRVSKGQTLLVLEAMKMRGDVPSPADGVVRDIRVAAGANARAKEPMMWIRPESVGR